MVAGGAAGGVPIRDENSGASGSGGEHEVFRRAGSRGIGGAVEADDSRSQTNSMILPSID